MPTEVWEFLEETFTEAFGEWSRIHGADPEGRANYVLLTHYYALTRLKNKE